MPSFSKFSGTLIIWYEEHKRDLPWRKTTDPYIIWVSEIILQQTRVMQGISYFERFVERFPSLESLANANEVEVLNLWQGLGYYSRARNMHYTSKSIMENHGGKFPQDYNEILKLKGIGDYTASAIASFSFNLPHPVIDGNVIRVISRLFGIDAPIENGETKKQIRKNLENLFDKKNPANFNQAIMEFGALQCTPVNPNCGTCPFSTDCIAHNTGKTSVIPLKKKAGAKRQRYFDYVVLRKNDMIAIRKRTDKDIWQNMYDFPLKESQKNKSEFELSEVMETNNIQYKKSKKSKWNSHILSHQKIFARFHEFHLEELINELPENCEFIELSKASQYPFPKLIETYINGL